MTDRELLLELTKDIREMKHDMQVMKNDIHELKEDVQGLKDDVQVLKEDVQGLKDDVQGLKEDMQTSDQKLTRISLMLENETNRNIQILAENHLDIIDKMNAAIRVQDKSMLYEVQISGLKMRVDCLEQDLAHLKNQAKAS